MILRPWFGDEHGHHLLDMKRFVLLQNRLQSQSRPYIVFIDACTFVKEHKNLSVVSFIDCLYRLLDTTSLFVGGVIDLVVWMCSGLPSWIGRAVLMTQTLSKSVSFMAELNQACGLRYLANLVEIQP